MVTSLFSGAERAMTMCFRYSSLQAYFWIFFLSVHLATLYLRHVSGRWMKNRWKSVCKSDTLKADSHIACRVRAVPLPCHAAKGLECVFPIWFTQCGCVWFTLTMPCPCHALTLLFFARPRYSTAVERRPVGYLPTFGFFHLPRRVPQKLLSEAYQSSQWSIPTTVKSGSSTLQKRRELAVQIFPATMWTFTKDMALSEQGRSAAWHVWIKGTTWAWHGQGILRVNRP
jgi:hypothetical protein